jgi:hypothetical protein
MPLPTFQEWLLLKKGEMPVQARINPFPTTKAHLERMRTKVVKPRHPGSVKIPGTLQPPALG